LPVLGVGVGGETEGDGNEMGGEGAGRVAVRVGCAAEAVGVGLAVVRLGLADAFAESRLTAGDGALARPVTVPALLAAVPQSSW
jgi:hypothetical protein